MALAKFNEVNYEYRNFSFKKQWEIEKELIENIVENPKIFHSYVRSRTKGKPKARPLREASGEVLTDSLSMAESFLEAFTSVFSNEILNDPAPHQYLGSNIDEIDIGFADIASSVCSQEFIRYGT